LRGFLVPAGLLLVTRVQLRLAIFQRIFRLASRHRARPAARCTEIIDR
jgi:hypothetical protein